MDRLKALEIFMAVADRGSLVAPSRRNQHLRVRTLIDHLADALALMIKSEAPAPDATLAKPARVPVAAVA